MVTLKELRLTYDVLSELMDSARTGPDGQTWHTLGAARSVVAAHIHLATAEAGFSPDWRVHESET